MPTAQSGTGRTGRALASGDRSHFWSDRSGRGDTDVVANDREAADPAMTQILNETPASEREAAIQLFTQKWPQAAVSYFARSFPIDSKFNVARELVMQVEFTMLQNFQDHPLENVGDLEGHRWAERVGTQIALPPFRRRCAGSAPNFYPSVALISLSSVSVPIG